MGPSRPNGAYFPAILYLQLPRGSSGEEDDGEPKAMKPAPGANLGVLMLDTRFPRPVGDLGNAVTYPFPVLFHIVSGASPDAVVRKKGEGHLDAFIDGARALVADGVDGILCNCGFLILFQEQLAKETGVPVLSSPMMQLRLVERALPAGKRAGILTISEGTLTDEHLAAADLPTDTPRMGTEGGTEFSPAILEDRDRLDMDMARRDVVSAAQALARNHPELGAIVLECTNMSPYAADIHEATGLPVATPFALACWFREMLAPRRF